MRTLVPIRALSLALSFPVVLALFGLTVNCFAAGICLFDGEVGDNYLVIKQFPDARIVAAPPVEHIVVESNGKKRRLVCAADGDCESVFWNLLRRSGGQISRLSVETNDRHFYFVYVDHAPNTEIVTKVIETLNLEMVHALRTMNGHVIRSNDEAATELHRTVPGVFKWPKPGKLEMRLKRGEHTAQLITKFDSGGVLFCRSKIDDDQTIEEDDFKYFDCVTIEDLALHIEQDVRRPVVSEVDSSARYSFKSPGQFWKVVSVNKPLPLTGLGLTVSATEDVEVVALVIRDKRDPAETIGELAALCRPLGLQFLPRAQTP